LRDCAPEAGIVRNRPGSGVTSVFAHRGCTEGGLIENTLEAFAEARRLGADGVELDVRLTADGALAVHHDAEIEGLGAISQLGVADLPAHVPLLVDALAVCEGMVVNVEIKNPPTEAGHDPAEAVAALTAHAIDDAGWTDRVLVSSFQVSTLRAVQVADGRLAIGWLWPIMTPPSAGLDEAVEAGFRAVHPFVTLVDADLVDRAHAAGLSVNVWTVNAPDDLAALGALGVDAVITDTLTAALAIRGVSGPGQK
jgi:glycerophosphoryl diester phosphodiesterase